MEVDHDWVTLEFDAGPREPGYQTGGFDPVATPPSLALVAAIAEVRGEDPADLEPLNDTVDPDAVDAVLDPTVARDHPVSISILVDGAEITLSSDGDLEIVDRERDGPGDT